MKNLYPSIPIDEALKLIEKLLRESKTLVNITDLTVQSVMEILKWMFGLSYCEFNGKHYVLESGPIGLGVTGEVGGRHNLYGRVSNSCNANISISPRSMVLIYRRQ